MFSRCTLSHADFDHFAFVDAKTVLENVALGIPSVEKTTEAEETFAPNDFHVETRNVVKQDRRRSTLSSKMLPSVEAVHSISELTQSPTLQESQSMMMPSRAFPVFEDGSVFLLN